VIVVDAPIGFIPATAVFVALIMRAEFSELVALVALAAVMAFAWGTFDRMLAVP
jgi:hypothetical protein